jgi:large subunit ribosomal protein L18
MLHHTKQKHHARRHRHNRVRAKVAGLAARPRLTVFRSLKFISAQLIDDQSGKTLVSATEHELAKMKGTKTDRATALGKLLAEKAAAKKITTVVFDRGGHRYHGRIKAFAEAARTGGLTF